MAFYLSIFAEQIIFSLVLECRSPSGTLLITRHITDVHSNKGKVHQTKKRLYIYESHSGEISSVKGAMQPSCSLKCFIMASRLAVYSLPLLHRTSGCGHIQVGITCSTNANKVFESGTFDLLLWDAEYWNSSLLTEECCQSKCQCQSVGVLRSLTCCIISVGLQ